MGEYLSDSPEFEPYSFKNMKTKHIEHFGNSIIITELVGKANVITFRTTAAKRLHDFREKDRKGDSLADRQKVVEKAAKLIETEIKSGTTPHDNYPPSSDMDSEEAEMDFLPESLQVFLRTIIHGKDVDIKIPSIGQAIIQASQPKILIAPLQIGLGVQKHHHFASKLLINSLHSHGYCSSYSEIQLFERSNAAQQGTRIAY